MNIHRSDACAETINIGSDVEISILTLAELIVGLTNSKSKIVFKPPLPEGDMARRQPDISRMRDLLDRDLTSLESGISKLISHYQSAS
jgi:UDP-glucose 4-epimerase